MVAISPSSVKNFIVKQPVERIAPILFKVGLLRMTLYAGGQSTTKKSTLTVRVLGQLPRVTCRVTNLSGYTFSLEKPQVLPYNSEDRNSLTRVC